MMLCVPSASAAVVNVFTPLAFSAPVPRVVVPSRKVIVPVGVPVVAVRVAVSVTGVPVTTVVADAVRRFVVAKIPTVSVRTVETEPPKTLSPV